MSAAQIVVSTALLSVAFAVRDAERHARTVRGLVWSATIGCMLLMGLIVDHGWDSWPGGLLRPILLLGVSVPLSEAVRNFIETFEARRIAEASQQSTNNSQNQNRQESAPQRAPDARSSVISPGLTKDECAMIIAAKNENSLPKEEARAIPNQRLELAFGINSCFTSNVPERCKVFRNSVEDKLYVKGESVWPDYVAAALEVAGDELSDASDEVKLFDVVQMVTMKVMLKVLFQKDPTDNSKDEHIRILAEEVNKQWIRSKQPVTKQSFMADFFSRSVHNVGQLIFSLSTTGLVLSTNPDWAFYRQTKLRRAAEKIFGTWGVSNVDNPFNFILPGYETMWRVVLRCLVEIVSTRHATSSKSWKKLLLSFLDNPTKCQLLEGQNDDGLVAEHISLEALRLYPPTRHISRMHESSAGIIRIVIADVEAVHHAADKWLPDPLNFST